MSTCEGNLTSNELVAKTKEFDRYLKSVDWRTLKLFSQRFPVDWAYTCVFAIGLKPAFNVDCDEALELVNEILPPSVKEGVIETSNRWFVNVVEASKIIRANGQYFPDFNVDWIGNRDRIKRYVELRTTNRRQPLEEAVKTGLLFGYPEKSVLAYASHLPTETEIFHGFGMNFAATIEDRDTFGLNYINKCKMSGVEEVNNGIQNRVEKLFLRSLKGKRRTIRIINYKGSDLLEVVDCNKDQGLLVKDLLLLRKNPKEPLDDIDTLITIFGEKYHIREMKNPKEWEGGNWSQNLHDNSRDGIIQYLRMSESLKDYEYYGCHVEMSEFVNWLPEEIGKRTAFLLGKPRC